MDRKKIIALAASTLVAGTIGSPSLAAMADYCSYGTGSDIRSQLLEGQAANPGTMGDALASCPGGKCPRPKRPKQPETGKQGNRSWRTMTAASHDDKSDEGSCGEGTCGDSGESKPMQDEDKSDEGGCGEGTCGS